MGSREWKCPTCSKMVKGKKSDFDKHLVTHDPNVKCAICCKILKNPACLTQHMKLLHSTYTRPSCRICSRTFSTNGSLREHIENRHSSVERPRFPCTFPSCEKTYLTNRDVKKHVKIEHAENPVRFPCTLCAKEFKLRHDLDSHIATHTKEKTHKCATCGKAFAMMSQLKVHQLTHTDKSSRDKFMCPLCPQHFLRRGAMQAHIRIRHENLRNFSCTVCNKKFTTLVTMKNHVEARHPTNLQQIHSCDSCEYKSHPKVNFVAHRRRHMVQKRPTCYFCGRNFPGFSKLVRHFVIHTEERVSTL